MTGQTARKIYNDGRPRLTSNPRKSKAQKVAEAAVAKAAAEAAQEAADRDAARASAAKYEAAMRRCGRLLDGDGWTLRIATDGSARADIDAGALDSLGLMIGAVDPESLPIVFPIARGVSALDVWRGVAFPDGDAGIIAKQMLHEARMVIGRPIAEQDRLDHPFGVIAMEMGSALARRLRLDALCELAKMAADQTRARQIDDDSRLGELLDELSKPGPKLSARKPPNFMHRASYEERQARATAS